MGLRGWATTALAGGVGLSCLVGTAGCSTWMPANQAGLVAREKATAVPPLVGRVYWSGTGREVNATLGEIASGATVSLVDLETGLTVATTVTSANGAFELEFGTWRPTANQPYALEAVKGLKVGGSPNRVGASAARLRTVIAFTDGGWTSLTGAEIRVSRASTAISAIAGLRALSVPGLRSLLSKLGESDTFSPAAGISSADFSTVLDLVGTCLALDQDPIQAITLVPDSGAFIRRERIPVVTDLSATSGEPGDQIVISGNHFDLTSAVNQVSFGGVPAASVEVDATGTRLTVSVPEGAVTGPVTVTVGGVSASSQLNFKLAGLGAVTRLAGNGIAGFSPDGTLAKNALIDWSGQMVVDPAGGLIFVDGDNQLLRKIGTDGTLSTLASGFHYPTGLARDASGNLYVGDTANARVAKVTPTGTVTTFAGTFDAFDYGGDGGQATSAKLNGPTFLAFDSGGSLYICDGDNHRIRKVSTGGVITTFAGTGTCGFSGDGGQAASAEICAPFGIAVDGSGNVYFADSGNRRVRKVTATGVISTVAGNGSAGYSGDGGPAVQAAFKAVSGVAISPDGDLLISDTGTYRVRKVDANGTVTTVLGTDPPSPWAVAADGTAALDAFIGLPLAMAFGPDGEMYLSTGNNNLIWKVH